jgi:hypothetical protein
LVGAGILVSLLLSTIIAYALLVVFVIYPLIKQILRYFNYLPTPCSKDIIRTQYTARCDGDICVGANEQKSKVTYIQHWRSYKALQK